MAACKQNFLLVSY